MGVLVAPVMPRSASELWKRLGLGSDPGAASLQHVTWGELKPGTTIARGESLFPRIDKAAYLKDAETQRETRMDTPQPTAPQPPAPAPAIPSAPAPQAAAAGPAEIAIDDFARVDLRTAKIVAAEKVQGADRLLKLTVDIGTGTRTIVAGIAAKYSPESLVGKTVVVVANLKPAKLRGVVSQGMLLAASDAGGQPYILTTEEPVPPGWKVK